MEEENKKLKKFQFSDSCFHSTLHWLHHHWSSSHQWQWERKQTIFNHFSPVFFRYSSKMMLWIILSNMLTLNNSSSNIDNVSDRQRADYNDVNTLLKCGFMIKRSQNKKRFTSVNYKRRWFELNLVYLHYYDVQNDQVSTS